MLDPAPIKNHKWDEAVCASFLLLVLKGPLAAYLIAHFIFGVD